MSASSRGWCVVPGAVVRAQAPGMSFTVGRYSTRSTRSSSARLVGSGTDAVTQYRRAGRVRTASAGVFTIGSSARLNEVRAGDQRQHLRPASGHRPHIPLPAPRSAQASARGTSPTSQRQRPRAGRQSGFAASRSPRRTRTRRSARRPHPTSRTPESLGEQAWRESGLGAPADIDQLNYHIVALEQHVVDVHLQLVERTQNALRLTS